MITHRGLPHFTISNVPCQACFQGKQSCASIPKLRTSKSTYVLQLVHLDIARPFQVKSLGGSSYFIFFIDDYSKKTWIYILAHKYKCLDKFRIFHKVVEQVTGKRIITLQTANGGKYTSNAWTSYCSLHGINKQFSQPYIPQYNGIAECKNKTLLDIVRCFLCHGNLPPCLHAKAIPTACIITNLHSTKYFPDKTLMELFSRVKPNITNLRIFSMISLCPHLYPILVKRFPIMNKILLF